MKNFEKADQDNIKCSHSFSLYSRCCNPSVYRFCRLPVRIKKQWRHVCAECGPRFFLRATERLRIEQRENGRWVRFAFSPARAAALPESATT